MAMKRCKYAIMGAGGWECDGWKKVECPDQVKDYNPDGTVNVVECMEYNAQREYEAAVEMQEYCERYEPTYNPEDGSM